MKKQKRKVPKYYHKPLSRIFIWAGFDLFICMLILCVFVGLLLMVYQRLDADGIKLLIFCFVLSMIFSYFLPLCSLIQVWRQERLLGIRWNDHIACDRSSPEQDWYLAYNRGGFLLYHRDYIQCLLNSQVVEQPTDLGRETVYCLRFEDIQGKKHTIKFSSLQDLKQFRQWYENEAASQ